MRIVLLWAIMQRVVVIPYRHFKTTYWYHLQRSRIQEGQEGFLTFEDGTYRLSKNVGKGVPQLVV